MQYSTFTHGNALAIETPSVLAGCLNVGWGTQLSLPAPIPQQTSFGIVYNEVGPGTWLHMPLTSTLTTFGPFGPRLVSVTLLFATEHCRITDVHVYDGAVVVHRFASVLKGNFLGSRDERDVDPERRGSNPTTFANTLKLPVPHKVFSAIGISFYVCAYKSDFDVHGHSSGPPFPQAILTVAGAGAQFNVTPPIDRTTAVVTIREIAQGP